MLLMDKSITSTLNFYLLTKVGSKFINKCGFVISSCQKKEGSHLLSITVFVIVRITNIKPTSSIST